MEDCPAQRLHVRELSEEERTKLEEDINVISDFKQNKLELEAKKNWDLFYKRNTTKFFKDRHWTTREFEELTSSCDNSDDHAESRRRVIFEVGCGVGNFMFPLLEEDPHTYFYACDFSPRAVDFVKSNPLYNSDRCTAFPCDITQDDITATVPPACVDITTLIFVLSAIHPEKMVQAIENVAKTLKPGGVLLIRDYGLYDYAMLRFSKGHKLSENFYVRQDGTRAFYFSLEKLNSIMSQAGLLQIQSSYIERATVNKKEGIHVPRIFVQGKYRKASSAGDVLGTSDRHSDSNTSMESSRPPGCADSCESDKLSVCSPSSGLSTVNGTVGAEDISSVVENLTLHSNADADDR
ncbi:tRNA N(3)-methylcytidine methyltransferase METTL6 [Aplysia californica]|uniref:tRNA N(3)-methylcytidine methyltransferase METTL6 n=1 Tax=Aplysia californica TaxID=6500 RepID=A0ABM0K756_APLCA|nr:tRNA N(3)-methylcytidine methyltransferase METTL6 [Aplysia californica]XP_035828727.1 tRNA N(3)-methylcytidine methyltransferase METTL6 [Aplysia californica]XP_035828728.1 tRNA N(3)-methylcytidine methyltransferase METTL6 [Aplysia californica]